MYLYLKMRLIPVYCYTAERASLHQLKFVNQNIINFTCIIVNVTRILRHK